MNNIQNIIASYCDSTITIHQMETLQEWLKQSPQNVDLFMANINIGNQVAGYFAQHLASQALSQDIIALTQELEVESAPIVDLTEQWLQRKFDNHTKQKTQTIKHVNTPAQPEHRPVVISKPLFYSVITAAILTLVFIFDSLSVKTSENISQPIFNVQVPLAYITAQTDVQLRNENSEQIQFKKDLFKGTYQLTKGLLQITYQNNANIIIQSPATFTLISENQIKLTSGNLFAHCPKTAHGFTIITPQSSFIDLGTDFGVEVDPIKGSQCHVITGSVVVTPTNLKTKNNNSIFLYEKQSGLVKPGQTTVVEIAYEPRKFIQKMVGSYELAILNQKPLAYLSMSYNQKDKTLKSQGQLGINPEIQGYPEFVSTGIALPHNDHGLSIYDNKSYINLSKNKKLNLKSNFTVEAWIKPSPTNKDNVIRIISNRDNDTGFALGIIGKLKGDPVGKPGAIVLTFFGRNDIVTDTPVPLDQWSHIAVVVDENENAKFYINGQITKSRIFFDRNFTATAPNSKTSGNPLFVGRNPFDKRLPQAWKGSIDELAIYGHQLTQKTILNHAQHRSIK